MSVVTIQPKSLSSHFYPLFLIGWHGRTIIRGAFVKLKKLVKRVATAVCVCGILKNRARLVTGYPSGVEDERRVINYNPLLSLLNDTRKQSEKLASEDVTGASVTFLVDRGVDNFCLCPHGRNRLGVVYWERSHWKRFYQPRAVHPGGRSPVVSRETQ